MLSGDYLVDIAVDAEVALHRFQKHLYDLVICDYRLPGISGHDLYLKLRGMAATRYTPFILCSQGMAEYSSQSWLQETLEDDPLFKVLAVPFAREELTGTVAEILQTRVDP